LEKPKNTTMERTNPMDAKAKAKLSELLIQKSVGKFHQSGLGKYSFTLPRYNEIGKRPLEPKSPGN
jgi:hypothetical protein